MDIFKEFRFEAAHRLPNVPPDHKCHRLHGHSFLAEVHVSGDVDEETGWVYYMASPDDPIRRYLYRVPLDGSMRAERVSPADQSGTHAYNMSPDAKWALHTFSTYDTPPVYSMVELPSHRVARVMADNVELRDEVAAIKQRPTEFFRVDIGQVVG